MFDGTRKVTKGLYSESSEGIGIDSEELIEVEFQIYTITERAEAICRSEAVAFIPGFSLSKRESKNLGITAIVR